MKATLVAFVTLAALTVQTSPAAADICGRQVGGDTLAKLTMVHHFKTAAIHSISTWAIPLVEHFRCRPVRCSRAQELVAYREGGGPSGSR
ncbi:MULTISPECIES: hypothetical protein [unclassified Streptomyces]|uniref:hypothetical protein n=1 Tax=unclassified Streptomyces TaxID=2593676 RepID=UPI001BE7A45D|nr:MULTISPECIES: hypothetical protein [unclassified Streptomyces]MBT2407055.1 hypothetical protein [Streptomyces sp. ISL-21]MBT2611806.1 hypothetical protein [Streptomyces sp. ISL-87]